MPPDSPTGFQSFADWLGLNQQSLDELEAQAAQRAQAKSAEAEGALGSAYQEALRNAETGGDASLSRTASYGDFLRLQREASQTRMRQNMSVQEFGANQFDEGPALPDLRARASQFQAAASQRGADRRTDAKTAETMKRQQDEAKAKQAREFSDAEARMPATWKDRQRYGAYSDAVKKSYESSYRRPGQVRVISQEEQDAWNQ